MKKSFEDLNFRKRGEGMRETLTKATASGAGQGEVTPEEEKARRAALRTQGRKGLKEKRVNMPLPEDVHDYVAVVSRAYGMPMSKFILAVLRKYMNTYPDDYEKAKELQAHLQIDKISEPDEE